MVPSQKSLMPFGVLRLLRILLLLLQCSLVRTYSFQGKRVLVTGSSGGIGKGIALELAKRGAHVVIHYHTRESEAYQLQQEIGQQQYTCLGVFHCDFRKLDSIPGFFERIVNEACGGEGPDILVNNAGAVTKLALEDDDDTLQIWHDTMAVNLHAPNLLSKLALPYMKMNANGGVIINVSSIHGERSNEYMGAYAASKAALDSLTRTMALEFAPYKVRVNAIAPGVVPVERTHQAFQDPALRNAWEERTALGTLGTVEEVALACIPLIENEWITGSIWQIDGGMMCRNNMPVRARPEAPK
jgi:NAD(P)-dependent dehydrogenase (short-subunit alcohol dehydrogenase family)